MTKPTKFSPNHERAVRMVFDAKDQYESQRVAIVSIAAKIGCTAETLRRWQRPQECDTGQREGLTTVIPPFLTVARSRGHAASANFCFGVMPPSAMFGRS